MKRKMKSNSGFTLVELIIAIAILAFLMTAVSSFMTTSVATNKKAKADITVSTSAQETYEQLSDSFKSAQNVILCVYEDKPVLDFSLKDQTASGFASTNVIYYVRDEAQKNELKLMPEYDATNSTIKYYSDIPEDELDEPMYVKKLIIDTAVELDYNLLDTAKVCVGTGYKNKLTGEMVADIREQDKEVTITQSTEADGSPTLDPNGNYVYDYTYSGDLSSSSTGKTVYDLKDTCRKIFTFDQNTMYLERKYAFMDLDDYYGCIADDSMKNYTYTNSLGFMKIDDTNNVTGCTVKVDPDNGTVDVNLFFNDKNMTYTSNGKVNIQNSYVLKAKK